MLWLHTLSIIWLIGAWATYRYLGPDVLPLSKGDWVCIIIWPLTWAFTIAVAVFLVLRGFGSGLIEINRQLREQEEPSCLKRRRR